MDFILNWPKLPSHSVFSIFSDLRSTYPSWKPDALSNNTTSGHILWKFRKCTRQVLTSFVQSTVTSLRGMAKFEIWFDSISSICVETMPRQMLGYAFETAKSRNVFSPACLSIQTKMNIKQFCVGLVVDRRAN